ncbi:MAG: glycosyltransferase family 4 protein [Deltaproteobacteria bacterium]|nr:glycosyltransferase family 4 protein [Deltaproteobacteria bacterium]
MPARPHRPSRLLPSADGEVAAWLRAQGREPDLLAPPARPRGKLARLRRLPGLVAYYRKLFRYFRMYDFSLVWSVGLEAHWLSAGLKARFNVPLVWQLWSIVPPGRALGLFRAAAAVFSDHVVASSLYVAHQLGRSLRWRRKLSVLYRGYERGLFPQLDPVVARREEGAVFVTRATASATSGHKTFLRAFERLRRSPAAAARGARAVVLVESESCALAVRELVASLELETHVSLAPLERGDAWTGLAPQLVALGATAYVNADVGVEAFHPDVVEAMGARVPVIGARQGALSELILHEATGLLATAGDSAALGEELLHALSDCERRRELALDADREFKARFALARYVDAVERILVELIGDETRAAASESDSGRDAA